MQEDKPKLAVVVCNAVKPDFIACLEAGKKLNMLKRDLRINFKTSS